VSPHNSSILLLGTVASPARILRSQDGGESWSPSEDGFREATDPLISVVRKVAFDPGDSNTLYLANTSSGHAVFKSKDGGFSWQASEIGVRSHSVSEIAVDPSNPDRLYAGATNGLYRTANGG